MTSKPIRACLWLAAPFLGAFLWLLTASTLWSHGTGRPFAILAWWHATHFWFANWWCKLWLGIGAVIPSLIVILILSLAVQRWRVTGRVQRRLTDSRGNIHPTAKPLPAIRGPTDNHGHTDWRSLEDTIKRFDGLQPPHGGIVVGEAYRVDFDTAVAGKEFDPRDETTWGMGGKAPLLIDSCTKGARAWHSAEFAPTGSGKSSELVTKALLWTGSSVVFDPTVEVGPRLDRALRRQRKRVFHIGLEDPSTHIRMTGTNVLSPIDVTHPEAGLHLRNVVSRIYDVNAANTAMEKAGMTDPFFTKLGFMLVTCLLAHLVWQDPDTIEISLATFAAGMATPEDDMISLLHKIHATSPSMMARRRAGTLMQARALETFSGIYLNAVSGVEWLFEEPIADLLSVGDFDPRYLLVGNCTAFLNIDLRVLDIAPMVPRVLIGSLLDTLFMANGHVHGLVAFFIDEADTLKTLDALKTARDQGRHYKIVLHMLWQSLHQMLDTWGTAQGTAWLDAFSWVGYAGIRASGAGKELATNLGGYGVLAYSEGNNQGNQRPFGLSFGTFSRGQNVNVHEISHRLITASEMQQDVRSDELIIVTDTGMPIRCGRAFWFRRSELVQLLAQ